MGASVAERVPFRRLTIPHPIQRFSSYSAQSDM
jgi:hypothetical protein